MFLKRKKKILTVKVVFVQAKSILSPGFSCLNIDFLLGIISYLEMIQSIEERNYLVFN